MAEVQRSSLTRVIMASLIGTTIEWYDFFLYGSAAALVFNKLFFPSFDPLVGTLLAFATYAVGFVARPLGGIVFGHYGDRIGRKKLLMWSLVMMGVATLLIGLLPGYASIGVWAPIGLIVLRVVQGFAVGGEWGGAVLMVAEHGDAKRRGYWASWPQAGVPLGSLLSAGILALMANFQSEADFIAWGWRVPFLLSAVLVVIGWYIRNRVAESPMFEAELEAAEAPPKLPIMDVVRERPRGILLGAGLQGRREHRLLHPDRLLADLPGRRRERKPQPRARRLADRRRGPVRRDPAARQPVRPDRPPRGLCIRRVRARHFRLHLLPDAGER